MIIEIKFAAFIMTYERPDILIETISKLLSQSYPPEKILVVDNSQSDNTEIMVRSLNNPLVEYHCIGYNSGPAGAARIGLQKLTQEGYDWIYWGDDDDPPHFEDSFEKLFSLAGRLENRFKIGVLGAVGHFYNKKTGNLVRTLDHQLTSSDMLMVDSIAGGQCMIVNADMIRAGVLPDEHLFFGFEELDFCIKAKNAGYHLMVSTELFHRLRNKYGKLDYRQPIHSAKDLKQLKRQYYSTRNILIILARNRFYGAYVYQLLKGVTKAMYGYRYGCQYGMKNFKMISSGIYHAFNGTVNKYY